MGFSVTDFILAPIFLNIVDDAIHWSKKNPPFKIQDGIFLALMSPNMTTKLPYHTPNRPITNQIALSPTKLPYHTPMLRERGLNFKTAFLIINNVLVSN